MNVSTPMFLRLLFALQIIITITVAKTDLSLEYTELLTLKKHVQKLRIKNKINSPFPHIGYIQKVSAKHVVEKSLEILSKINLYRKKIDLGSIVVTPFPSRKIGLDDINKVLKRLVGELSILTSSVEEPVLSNREDISYIDLYRELWEISLGFDQIIGVSGFTPSDVYLKSIQVVELAKLLRQSQNLKLNVIEPETPENKHPNHSLYAAYDLISEISKVEKNLWMEEIEPREYPKRVVTPTEVYDTLGIIIAELQSIKYRLGLEKDIVKVIVQHDKTSNDVIANINYAIALLPSFDFSNKLIQHDRDNLIKSPIDVYKIAGNILHNFERLFEHKGIRNKLKLPAKIYGLQPMHVYQKVLENLEKMNLFRESIKMGKTAIARVNTKIISPIEVYELALRLERELVLVLEFYNLKYEKISEKIKGEIEIIPGDVYFRMQKIALMFDVIRAEEYTPNDSYIQAYALNKKVEKILNYFKKSKEVFDAKNNITDGQIQPRDVLYSSSLLLELIQKIKTRLNVKSAKLIIGKPKKVSSSDVYNGLRLIRSELDFLMTVFGIDTYIGDISIADEKLPADVDLIVKNSYKNLLRLMK